MKNFSMLLLSLLALAASAFAQFQFTSLDYPGGNLTTAHSINSRGDIVGGYRVVSPRHALLIRAGQYIPLAPNTILGSDGSDARKINNRGDVVGSYFGDDGFSHGFLLRRGVVTTLDFPGANDTFAWGINDLETIVGFWDLVDANGNVLVDHGFMWKNGVFTQFDFPGAADTFIFGINDRGDMVGGWDTVVNSPTFHGFACSAANCFSFDVPFAGATGTQGDDISVTREVVGAYVDSNGVPHGFRASGSHYTSFDFPGASSTVPWGINLAGQIVGNYFTADGVQHGFLATPAKQASNR